LIHDTRFTGGQRIGQYLLGCVFFIGDVAGRIWIFIDDLDEGWFSNGFRERKGRLVGLVVHWRRRGLDSMVNFSPFWLADAVAETDGSLSESSDVVDGTWDNGIVVWHLTDRCINRFCTFLERFGEAESRRGGVIH
jgi:hypothetical protein